MTLTQTMIVVIDQQSINRSTDLVAPPLISSAVIEKPRDNLCHFLTWLTMTVYESIVCNSVCVFVRMMQQNG